MVSRKPRDLPRDELERDIEALKPKPQDGPVTWLSLPRKDQLAILFLCRLVDFLQVASLQAYVFYQLKSFNPTLSDAVISTQAGILQGCFTGAQVLTAILWGKVADSRSGGRKLVLLLGLGGTAVSCLGYGFSKTFWQAACFRILGGGINGTVGIIRTMIAEITKEKKYQSRAFLILPMSFNIAGILGPLIGGILADPATTLPDTFGPEAAFGWKWLEEYPYALPSILNYVFLATTTLIVFFCLEETLKERKDNFDLGRDLAARFSALVLRRPPRGHIQCSVLQGPKAKASRKLPFARIWTKNVVFTLITIAFFDFHLGAFGNLWSLFLSTPRADDSTSSAETRTLPFTFNGGLGMPAATVGFATSILGVIGMILQLFLYPPVQARLGTLLSFRFFLLLFPFAYLLAPYLAVLPSSIPSPDPASGPFIWMGIVLVLLLQVTARTFTLPATIILLNNCSPNPSVLGTVHGIGQSVSAAFRTIGPAVGGWWYGAGLEKGVVGAAWWGIAGVSAAGCVTAVWVYEGSGHEIYLEGEGEEEPEMEGMLSSDGGRLSMEEVDESAQQYRPAR
ncbi:putative membrane protein [Lachnellula suecica]|uniref:Putative membrane protein n=1 Tax=Lachnellula suecica TaxID=602035 RepID=A0A8T9C4W8_9HELO|nr:putative membrane protein [Lachnellula suecica]